MSTFHACEDGDSHLVCTLGLFFLADVEQCVCSPLPRDVGSDRARWTVSVHVPQFLPAANHLSEENMIQSI